MEQMLPSELESVKSAAALALGRLKPADETTSAPKNLLFSAKRTDAGRELPPYSGMCLSIMGSWGDEALPHQKR
jgi:hypothetical protein